MGTRAVLVANPTAQSGRAQVWIERARHLLEQAGVGHELLPTLADRGTIGAVRRAIDQGGARLVIALGGDGTFADAAKGILAADAAAETTLGLLPMGTANDQAKSFGMRTGFDALADNVQVLVSGRVCEMDVGRVQRLDEADRVTGSDLFFDSMSIGLGAAVLAERNRDRERVAEIPLVRAFYRDQVVYAGALLKRLARLPTGRATFQLEAEVDDEPARVYDDVLDVIVKNTLVYGGEWVLAPGGAADDGLFEMVPVCGLADFGTKMVSAKVGSPIGEVELQRLGITSTAPVPGKRFVLTVHQPGATEPPAAQVDGEELPAGDRFRIDVLARILRLMVPSVT